MLKEAIKIYAVEVFNLNTTAMFCGQMVPKGCLGVTISRRPELLYEQFGRHFIAHDSGIISHYTHAPGTKDGFAGREFVLPVINQGKVFSRLGVTHRRFKGDLWESHEATEKAREMYGPIRSIGLRLPHQKTYCSYKCTQEFIDRLSRVVVMGEPQQSPLI